MKNTRFVTQIEISIFCRKALIKVRSASTIFLNGIVGLNQDFRT
jgi:hypothetical protein